MKRIHEKLNFIVNDDKDVDIEIDYRCFVTDAVAFAPMTVYTSVCGNKTLQDVIEYHKKEYEKNYTKVEVIEVRFDQQNQYYISAIEVEESFKEYLKRARWTFANVVNKYDVKNNLELRTAVDTFLIAYDQAVEKALVELPSVEECENEAAARSLGLKNEFERRVGFLDGCNYMFSKLKIKS